MVELSLPESPVAELSVAGRPWPPARYWWMVPIDMAPSPMAEVTRFTEPLRTSPTAKTRGMLVSRC
jgi:hypothetical protein